MPLMRPARTLVFSLLLAPILTSCGSVQIILKPPVEQQCGTAGLKGCPELTDGVLLYVQGQKAKGKDQLIKAAAQNAPEKLKKFAQALKELQKIPGVSGYMREVLEVADILASSQGGADASGAPVAGVPVAVAGVPVAGVPVGVAVAPGPRRRRRPGTRPEDLDVMYATADFDGPREGSIVAPEISSAKGPCGGLAGYTYCVWVTTGPLVVTELSTSPGCPVGLIAGAARSGPVIGSPRWFTRNPPRLGGARMFVRDGESLFIGMQAPAGGDTHCNMSWAGFRPWDAE
jgi:hypothetical protein